MTSIQEQRARLRLNKARASLEAARALMVAPTWDDAVNRAAAAALHAARALLTLRGIRFTAPNAKIDPEWRPGMTRAPAAERFAAETLTALLDAFERTAPAAGLPADTAQYLRTLAEDGHDADQSDAAAFDESEAVESLDTAERLVAAVARAVLGDDAARDATSPLTVKKAEA